MVISGGAIQRGGNAPTPYPRATMFFSVILCRCMCDGVRRLGGILA